MLMKNWNHRHYNTGYENNPLFYFVKSNAKWLPASKTRSKTGSLSIWACAVEYKRERHLVWDYMYSQTLTFYQLRMPDQKVSSLSLPRDTSGFWYTGNCWISGGVFFSEEDDKKSGHFRQKIGISGHWPKMLKNRDNPDFFGTVGNSGVCVCARMCKSVYVCIFFQLKK